MSKVRRGDADDEDRNPRDKVEEHLAPRIADKETLKTLKIVRLKGKDGQKENSIPSPEKKNPFASLVSEAIPVASEFTFKSNGLPTSVKQFSFNFSKSSDESHVDSTTLPKDGNAFSCTEGGPPKFNFNFGGSANTSKSIFNFATAAANVEASKNEHKVVTDESKPDGDVDNGAVNPQYPPTVNNNSLMSSSVISEQIDPSQKILGEIQNCNLFSKGQGKEWNDCGSASISLIKREGKSVSEVIMHASLTKRLLLQCPVDRTFGVLSKSDTSVVFYTPKIDPSNKVVKPAVWMVKFSSDDSSKAFVEILAKENAEK